MICVSIANVNLQKQNRSIQRQFELECNGFKTKIKKFTGCEEACKKLSKSAVNVAAHFLGLTLGAETKFPRLVRLLQTFQSKNQRYSFQH